MDVFVAGVSRANPLSPPTLSDVTRISNHDIHNFPTAWNPESTAVLFEHGVPSSVGLQSVEASPSQDIALSKSPSDAFSQARYSPDGRWILYRRVSPTDVHRYDLMRVASNGGTPQVVPTSVSVADFRCSTSAAGRCVLRLVEDRRALVYFDLDPLLGVGRELARTPWQPNIFGDWSISPDGTTVAMPNHDPAHPLIQLVPLASSAKAAPRQIPAPGFGTVLEANWASDGRGFFVETFAAPQYNLIWVDLQGNINLLRRSPELIYALNSPDGRKIAFPFNSANHNVWVGQATARALR